MSGLAWIILNVALAVGAVYGTMKVRSTPPPKPLQLEETAKPEVDGSHKAAIARAEKVPAENAHEKSQALPSSANLDDLWQQTLFLPTRTEKTEENSAEELAAEQAALAAQNIEFELVGIAQINVLTAEKPAPVAILRSKVGAGGGRQQNNRRGNPRERNNQRNASQAQAADTKSKGDERQVFHIGEKINQTGYILTSINPDEKMVEVTRNGETVKLYINFLGTEAMQRREAVTQAATKKQQEQTRRIEQENRARQQAQAANNQQQPNGQQDNQGNAPAAPTPGTPPDAQNLSNSTPQSVNPDARAERLRRIAEARQQRQAQNATGAPNSNSNAGNAAPPPPPGD